MKKYFKEPKNIFGVLLFVWVCIILIFTPTVSSVWNSLKSKVVEMKATVATDSVHMEVEKIQYVYRASVNNIEGTGAKGISLEDKIKVSDRFKYQDGTVINKVNAAFYWGQYSHVLTDIKKEVVFSVDVAGNIAPVAEVKFTKCDIASATQKRNEIFIARQGKILYRVNAKSEKPGRPVSLMTMERVDYVEMFDDVNVGSAEYDPSRDTFFYTYGNKMRFKEQGEILKKEELNIAKAFGLDKFDALAAIDGYVYIFAEESEYPEGDPFNFRFLEYIDGRSWHHPGLGSNWPHHMGYTAWNSDVGYFEWRDHCVDGGWLHSPRIGQKRTESAILISKVECGNRPYIGDVIHACLDPGGDFFAPCCEENCISLVYGLMYICMQESDSGSANCEEEARNAVEANGCYKYEKDGDEDDFSWVQEYGNTSPEQWSRITKEINSLMYAKEFCISQGHSKSACVLSGDPTKPIMAVKTSSACVKGSIIQSYFMFSGNAIGTGRKFGPFTREKYCQLPPVRPTTSVLAQQQAISQNKLIDSFYDRIPLYINAIGFSEAEKIIDNIIKDYKIKWPTSLKKKALSLSSGVGAQCDTANKIIEFNADVIASDFSGVLIESDQSKTQEAVRLYLKTPNHGDAENKRRVETLFQEMILLEFDLFNIINHELKHYADFQELGGVAFYELGRKEMERSAYLVGDQSIVNRASTTKQEFSTYDQYWSGSAKYLNEKLLEHRKKRMTGYFRYTYGKDMPLKTAYSKEINDSKANRNFISRIKEFWPDGKF